MRPRKIFPAVLALSALVLALGTGPAQGQERDRDPADREAASKVPNPLSRTERALEVLQDRIASYARSQGYRYTFGSYVDPGTGKIVLETDAPDSAVRVLTGGGTTPYDADDTAAVELLGAVRASDGIEVRREGLSDEASRKSDTEPFSGGSGVKGDGSVCTTGFAVKNSSGTRFLTIAGHCFTNGTKVRTENGGVLVGTVRSRGLPSHDMELIGGRSYRPYIYVGGTDSTSTLKVLSANDPVVGYANYCHSGRTTGERCGHEVISITAEVCTSSGCKKPVAAYRGGVFPRGGDSGAPVYVKATGSTKGVHIRGHHIAGNSTTKYFEMWNRIRAKYNVSILT